MTDFSEEGFPGEVEVIPLPGHFFDMVGYRMPDGAVFLADCVSSRETLDKLSNTTGNNTASPLCGMNWDMREISSTAEEIWN